MNRTPLRSGGWSFTALLRDAILTFKLLRDPAVPGMMKLLLPGLALLYMLWPIDLLPMLPFDDIAVALLAMRMFVSMAPRDSVERAVYGDDAAARGPVRREPLRNDPEVIDTTWRVLKD